MIHALGRKRVHQPEPVARRPAMAQPGKLRLEALKGPASCSRAGNKRPWRNTAKSLRWCSHTSIPSPAIRSCHFEGYFDRTRWLLQEPQEDLTTGCQVNPGVINTDAAVFLGGRPAWRGRLVRRFSNGVFEPQSPTRIPRDAVGSPEVAPLLIAPGKALRGPLTRFALRGSPGPTSTHPTSTSGFSAGAVSLA